MRCVLLCLLPVIALAGCVAPSRAPEPVRPLPPVTRAPPLSAASPVALPPRFETGVERGVWTYANDPRVSVARFGMVPQSPVLSIQCERPTRAISIQVARPGAVAGGAVTLRATTSVKSFASEGGGPYAIVRVDARDPILDALAFSRGRFGVALDGMERAFPAWPEFTRVVEDCRG